MTSLLDSSLSLNVSGVSGSLGSSIGLTSSLNRVGVGTEPQEGLLLLLGLGLVLDHLDLELTAGNLRLALGLVASGGLLGLGGDLDGQLHGALKGLTSTLVSGLDGLNINVGDDQVVGIKAEGGAGLSGGLVDTKDSSTNDVSRSTMEGIKSGGGNSSTNTRSNGLASTTNEIGDSKQLGTVLSRVTVNVKVPVVSQLQHQTSVIGGLHGDLIGHKVRTKEKAQSLESSLNLGGVSRESQDSELLISAQQNKIGSKGDTSLLFFVIVNLDSRVVRGTVGDNTVGITSTRSTSSRVVARITLLLEEVFDSLRKRLLPQDFVRLQHGGDTHNGTDGTRLQITNVDTLVFVQRNNLSPLDNLDFGSRDVVTRTRDHPLLSRKSLHITILEAFQSREKKCFLLGQHVDALHTTLQTFSGVQKEGNLSLSEFSLSDLVVPVLVDRVQHNTVLAVVQRGEVNFGVELFANVGDVNLSHLSSNQPGLSSLSLLSIGILEASLGIQTNSLGVSQDMSGNKTDLDFINRRKVRTNRLDQPFFTSNTSTSFTVNAVAFGTNAESTVLSNGLSLDERTLSNFNTRNVGSRSTEEPFFTSGFGNLVLSVNNLKVTNGSEMKGFSFVDNSEGGLFDNLLARVQRERLVENRRVSDTVERLTFETKADLLVSMSKFEVAVFIENRGTIFSTNNRVQNLNIVTRRDVDHLVRTRNNFLMFFSSVSSRTTNNRSDKSVVVQGVNVLVRLDPKHIGVGRRARHLELFLCVILFTNFYKHFTSLQKRRK
mmetsp:Transcript_36453/g.57172  ORF Transcript_36453/g.57172 Transcript_36453/m.57172 type:complete len:771 (+) Transcript_36453:417-2729(+)